MAEEAKTTSPTITRALTDIERFCILEIGEDAQRIVYEVMLCGRTDMAGTARSNLLRAKATWEELGRHIDGAIALTERSRV